MSSKIKQLLPLLLIPIVMILVISFFVKNGNEQRLTYYEVVELFNEDKIAKYTLNYASGVLEFTTRGEEAKNYKYDVPNVNMFLTDVHEKVLEHNLTVGDDDKIIYDYDKGSSNTWLTSLLPTIAMLLILGGVLFFMVRKMNQTMMNETNKTLSFGKARVKINKDEKRKTTFADVAGADEEKEELSEIVGFLKDPLKFNEIGARIPKGVLLVGPPGTGKTLLARAVAGEANAPFFSISGSDFVEMYVGVGASRVRDLFEQAKKNSPAIIFIDEIDAVGRHRGAGMGGGHDEREQTLNQLLVEMDGFGANEGVIVIAATNRPDILDPALLRPGRFDRQVTVGYPDVKGRAEILKVHSKNKSMAPDVDLEAIARSTVGFTGADLENLLNEAALLAARRDRKAITMAEIEDATMKVLVGTEKKSHKISEEDKRITAYHESGHAIATYYLPDQDPVQHVSIIPRGMAAGFTMSRPEKDHMHVSRQHMLNDLVMLLGGRAAEKLFIGDVCTGASNDIQRATETARDMVTKYGMSDSLGPIMFGSGHDEVFLGKDYGTVKNYSEEIAAEIDKEVNKIISTAYEKSEAILKDHGDNLKKLAEYLIVNEKIDGKDFALMMEGKFPPEPPVVDAGQAEQKNAE